MEKNRKFNLVATAASGLEALVGKELREMMSWIDTKKLD